MLITNEKKNISINFKQIIQEFTRYTKKCVILVTACAYKSQCRPQNREAEFR